MNFIEYEKKHKDTLFEIIRQVAYNSISLSQCEMIVQSFKIGLKMIKMGMVKELLFTEQQVNDFRFHANDISKKHYQLDVKNTDLLIKELLEIEDDSKQLFFKNKELRKDFEAHLAKFPLPSDTPAEIHELIESNIYDNTITRKEARH